jgi:putative ABC transport system permease protein
MIAYRNLVSKKLRTMLTLFGIAIGIGSIYFLLSFGLGLQNIVTNEVIGSQSIKTVDVSTPNSRIIKLDDITSQRVSDIPNVETLGSAYYYPGSFKLSNAETDAIVYGIDKGYEDLTYLDVIEGSLPSASDAVHPIIINQSALEAIGLADKPGIVIGQSVRIFVPLEKISENVQVLEQDFTVVGVIGSGGGPEVFVKSTVFRDIGVDAVTQLKVGVSDVGEINLVRSQIESFGLETQSPADTLDEINTIFRYFNILLLGFGGIGMIIAVLGMFNTLTISLLERTKEIGLMVSLGARSLDMRLLFVIEAVLLSMFGALLGIIGATLLSIGVNVLLILLSKSREVEGLIWLFSYPWWLFIASIVFMVIVGFAVVWLPARRAEKINPIDALRRE